MPSSPYPFILEYQPFPFPEDMFAVHGYTDAADERAHLVETSRRWDRLWAHEFDNLVADFQKQTAAAVRRHGFTNREAMEFMLAQEGGSAYATLHRYARMVASLGYHGIPDDGAPILEVTNHVSDSVNRALREAPLMYLSPASVKALGGQPLTCPPLRSLPFASPMVLWYGVPTSGDPFGADNGTNHHSVLERESNKRFLPDDVRQWPMPLRVVLVVPDTYQDILLYQSYAFSGDLRQIVLRDEGEEGLPSTRHWPAFFPDTIGQVTVESRATNNTSAALVSALNSMMAKGTRMAEVGAGPRHVVKRAKRARVVEPDSVNVIYLPRERTEYVPSSDEGEASGSTRRRHMVRAHWRMQPYGPRGAGLRKLTKVSAHERGTGPLVRTRNVYTVTPDEVPEG